MLNWEKYRMTSDVITLVLRCREDFYEIQAVEDIQKYLKGSSRCVEKFLLRACLHTHSLRMLCFPGISRLPINVLVALGFGTLVDSKMAFLLGHGLPRYNADEQYKASLRLEPRNATAKAVGSKRKVINYTAQPGNKRPEFDAGDDAQVSPARNLCSHV